MHHAPDDDGQEMADRMTIVALIPARAGSKRIPGKNTRLLAGRPLIAYTIAAAQQSGIFSNIEVCTDDEACIDIAGQYGVAFARRELATDDEPDIWWIQMLMLSCPGTIGAADAFAILRPTNPFRTAATIQRAWAQFQESDCHSLRAVQRVLEHPGKMWQLMSDGRMYPLIGRTWPPLQPEYAARMTSEDRPWHSLPTQTLPPVFVQNASLEMARSYVVPAFGTISGTRIAPFRTEGYEGVDLNTEADWQHAESLIASGAAVLPPIETPCPR